MRFAPRLVRLFAFCLALLLPFAAVAKGGHGGGGHGGHSSSHGGSATSFPSGHGHTSGAVTPSSSAAVRRGSSCANRDERGNCGADGGNGAADRSPEMRGFERRDTEISVP